MPREIDAEDARQGRRVLGRRNLPIVLTLLVVVIVAAIVVVALLV